MAISVAQVRLILGENLKNRPSDIEISVRYVDTLFRLIGSRMSHPIDVEGVLTITADLIDAMLNDKDPDCVAYMEGIRRFNQRSRWVAGLRQDAKRSRSVTDTKNHPLSPEVFFGGGLSALSRQHKEKFLRGETVTYQDVLGVNPEMFFAIP